MPKNKFSIDIERIKLKTLAKYHWIRLSGMNHSYEKKYWITYSDKCWNKCWSIQYFFRDKYWS